MDLLDENNFVENRNGHVVESQLAELKQKANIWADLLIVVGAFAFVIYFRLYEGEAPQIVIWSIAAVFILFWLTIRLPAIIKYYFLALPDARANRLAYATGKLAYRRGYVLQTDDIRLSLPGDKNEGLLAGNIYEVCYLPRARMAVSAKIFRPVSESQQMREFTLLFEQLLGFTDDDIQANRSGELTSNQKMTIVKKSWWVILLMLFIIALALSQILPMFIPPVFLDDAIVFTVCVSGLGLFLIGVILLGSMDARNLLSLFEGKLENMEGVVHLSERTTGYGKSRATHYYLGIDTFELRISQHAYEVLIDGLYCRVYYTPRFKYLASVEVLKA